MRLSGKSIPAHRFSQATAVVVRRNNAWEGIDVKRKQALSQRKVTIRMSADVARRLKICAAIQSRTMEEVVTEALTDYFKRVDFQGLIHS